MRSADDEARTLRARIEDLEATLDRLESAGGLTSAAVLAQTVTVSSYPTGNGPKVVGVKAVTLAVAETEGATPTLTQVGSVFYACIIGSSTLPTVGSNVLLEQTQARWVTRT